MFSEVFAQCLGRLYAAALVIIVERQIVQRRDLVIRYGRRLQRFLRLPEYMCVVSETDPGMLDQDIRIGAELLCFLCVPMCVSGLVLAVAFGTLGHPVVIGLTIVGPGCIAVIAWLVLILRKRSRPARQLQATQDGEGRQNGGEAPSIENWRLLRGI